MKRKGLYRVVLHSTNQTVNGDWFVVVALNAEHAIGIVHNVHFEDEPFDEFLNEFGPIAETVDPKERIGCQGEDHPWEVHKASTWSKRLPTGPFISNTYED